MQTPDIAEMLDGAFQSIGLGSYSLEKHFLVLAVMGLILVSMLMLVIKLTGGNKNTAKLALGYLGFGFLCMLSLFTFPVGIYFIFKSFDTAVVR